MSENEPKPGVILFERLHMSYTAFRITLVAVFLLIAAMIATGVYLW